MSHGTEHKEDAGELYEFYAKPAHDKNSSPKRSSAIDLEHPRDRSSRLASGRVRLRPSELVRSESESDVDSVSETVIEEVSPLPSPRRRPNKGIGWPFTVISQVIDVPSLSDEWKEPWARFVPRMLKVGRILMTIFTYFCVIYGSLTILATCVHRQIQFTPFNLSFVVNGTFGIIHRY
ncbi:uncharacterized protein LOC101856788 isoform X2 [Aplysia californica]|uniref:Uncharacterized protein LOC101856788 isoform X2 n=1 Tax=Aplysia californica TaxID=6500 RepID=A0ABM0JHB7_APLCA|nr:uncharacterized protein LOC101856788 isoform X2 [Aplysia californica]